MNELYRTSETSDTSASPADTGADAASQRYEDPASAGDLTRYEGTLEGDDYASYDDGGTLAAEEDGLPTRQEAREQTWGDDPGYYDENDLAAYYDGDTSTLGAEEEGLPTRQEAREQAWGDHPENYDENEFAAGYDGDTNTLADEEDGLPTRQEAWQQTWGDTAREQTPDMQDALGTATSAQDDSNVQEAAANELPGTTLAETADYDVEHAPSEQVTVHDQYGHDVPITVIHATAEDRTVGDDKPSEIDHKPTGEELLDMDSESVSRLDMFRKEAYESMDNITDIAKEDGETIGKLFERPPTGTKTEVPAAHPEITAPPYEGVDGGHLALAGIVAGVVLFEGARTVKEKISQWRGRRLWQ